MARPRRQAGQLHLSPEITKMFYILVNVDSEQLFQEVFNGNVQRYTQLDGVTKYIQLPRNTGSTVIDARPVQPTWALSDPITIQPVADNQLLTRAALRNRFTVPEKIAMEMAMLDDPTKTTQERTGSAYLRAMINDFNNSPYVDLNHAVVASALNTLEQYGIIGIGRAQVILSAPIAIEEAYRA